MSKPQVAILCGSDSDLSVLRGSIQTLESFNVSWDLNILSAHRTPEVLDNYLRSLENGETRVLICAAGMAAHLAGAVAARTSLPVIGLPLATPPFEGLDALLSTVQMPSGVPVLTVSTGKAGAVNAALAAVRIIALFDASLKEKLKSHREKMKAAVLKKNQKLKSLGIDKYVED